MTGVILSRLYAVSGGRRGARRLVLSCALALVASAAAAADYAANLGPMPLDDETKLVIAGRGEVTASLVGRTLSVRGGYRGLPSAATKARLWESTATGVPGRPVRDLEVTGGTEGTLRGTVSLTVALERAARTGRLYVQLDSEKAPPGYAWGPKGTLWGWLLPAHPVAAAGEPQQGHWFIPQLDTPAR